jgi:glucokinase
MSDVCHVATTISPSVPGPNGAAEELATTMNHPKRDEPLYGVVDVGGTKIVAGVATATEILATTKIATEVMDGADAVTGRIAGAIRSVQTQVGLEHRPLAGVGMSVPGPLDTALGIVSFTPNLHWVDYPAAARLSAALNGVPVFIDDDANCAGQGEAAFGAGIGYGHQVYLTISTGIGGAVIVDGRIDRGFRDAAGEVGHMTIVPGGPDCLCGNSGCLEAIASGTAIARRARQLMIQEQDPTLTRLTGGDPDRVTAPMVFEAAAAGDVLCQMVLDDVATYLGIALANIVMVLNPQAIILGGGVMEQAEVLLPRIDQRMRMHLIKVQREGLVLRRAALGDSSGLMGALQLVLQHRGAAAEAAAVPPGAAN